MTRTRAAGGRLVVVDPSGPSLGSAIAEIWRYRELLFTLVARELQVRYAQTWVGVAWVLLKPLVTMLLLWAVFGIVAGLPTDGLPRPIFFFSGLVLWFFFSGAVTDSKDSLVDNADLIRKVYFPRPLLPIATVLARLVDLAIMLAFLFVLLIYYQVPRFPALPQLAAVVAVSTLLAIAVGLWMGALNVRYRDTTHVVPVGLQLLMFASPIVYSSSLVPTGWRGLYSLNPLAGLIEGFRTAIAGGSPFGRAFVVAALVTGALAVSALLAFRRMDASFADYV
jgi:lipopolysaccharide transport system permease protein